MSDILLSLLFRSFSPPQKMSFISHDTLHLLHWYLIKYDFFYSIPSISRLHTASSLPQPQGSSRLQQTSLSPIGSLITSGFSLSITLSMLHPQPTIPSSTSSNLPLWQCHVILVPGRMREGAWEFPSIHPGKEETRHSCFTPCSLFLSLSTHNRGFSTFLFYLTGTADKFKSEQILFPLLVNKGGKLQQHRLNY